MFKRIVATLAVIGAVGAGAAALAQVAANKPTAPSPAAAALTISEASFGCIRDLKPVRGFYVGNLLGDLDGTLAAANSNGAMPYPPGSVVQLVPGEAMVKHPPGYNSETRDWEFFELDVAPGATKIRVRGTGDVVNQFGGNCLGCHAQAEAKWDMICEQGHGCAPIPVTPVMARAIQNTDPRCAKIDNLPADQVAALQQLVALRAATTGSAGN